VEVIRARLIQPTNKTRQKPAEKLLLAIRLFGFVHNRADASADCGSYRACNNEAGRGARGGAFLHVVATSGQQGEAEERRRGGEKHRARHYQLH
jgi:hypothetical protein